MLISDRLALGFQLRHVTLYLEGIRKYLKSKAKQAIKILKLTGIPSF